MTSMPTSTNGPQVPDRFDLFPELATSLFYWVERLHRTLVEQGVEQVFFLSREGQPLMRMFEAYRQKAGGRIALRYLEVSRRSTLLPSLAPLAEEGFETLFRQYRRMSLLEFLSSLGLRHRPATSPGRSAWRMAPSRCARTTFRLAGPSRR